MGQDTELRRLRGFGDTTFVTLAREGAAVTDRAPLPEADLHLDAAGDGDPWSVRGFTAVEGLSAVYECVVDLAHTDLAANPDAMLGRPAVLRVTRGDRTRRFCGVVRRVEHRGTSASHRLARAWIVPALWALSQRSDARVFQDVTAVDVVEAVLREAGLYAGMLDVQVRRALPAREYCVQYRESDLDFVLRLLAEEGVGFFFRHDDETETLVLCDGAHAWGQVPTLDGEAIPVAGPEGATQRVEVVRHLTWERELRSTSFTVRDFDFTRTDLRVERSTPRRRDPTRARYEPSPELTLGGYTAPTYTTDDAGEQATLRHEGEQVDGAVGTGEGAVTGMAPGSMFQLAVAGAHVPAQRYVVTRVEHEARAPEVLLQGTSGERAEVDRYRNRFACIPVEVAYRPPRRSPRPTIAGLLTAIVVGPPGEEIYTDEHGRIKVQFHWDRVGTRDAQSSCWMRVVQGPWAGGHWGFQFVPRVGMEVAVAFVEGDPDRPVVTGSLFNGRHRVVHPLPEEKTRSAIRSQSSPGGHGYNELRFEDRAGAEEVYIHAQRDLVEEVLHCHATRVGATQQNVVLASQVERVGDDQDLVVGRDQLVRVERYREVTVAGGETLRTMAGRESVVDTFSVERVEGRAVHHVTPLGAGSSGADPVADEALRRARRNAPGGALETWVVEGDRAHRVSGTERVELGARQTHVAHDDRLAVSGNLVLSAQGDVSLTTHGAGASHAVGLSLRNARGQAMLRHGGDGLDVDAESLWLHRVMEGLLLSADGALLSAAEGTAEVLASDGQSQTWGLRASVADGDAQLTSKDGSSLRLTRDVTVRAKGDLVLSNDGGASITLRASGEVEIRGTRIQLRS